MIVEKIMDVSEGLMDPPTPPPQQSLTRLQEQPTSQEKSQVVKSEEPNPQPQTLSFQSPLSVHKMGQKTRKKKNLV